jgi:hypothetical protein
VVRSGKALLHQPAAARILVLSNKLLLTRPISAHYLPAPIPFFSLLKIFSEVLFSTACQRAHHRAPVEQENF